MELSRTKRGVAARLIAGAVAFGALGVLVAACGSTNTVDPTPVKQFKITPADPGRSTAIPSVAAAATAPAGDGTSAGSTISIIALDIKFDKDKLAAPAGEITVTLDNRDSGSPHNIHFRKGTKPSGESVGATDLESGPLKQTLKLNLAAGDYYYQCDAHPAMKGVLTVS